MPFDGIKKDIRVGRQHTNQERRGVREDFFILQGGKKTSAKLITSKNFLKKGCFAHR